MRFDINLKQSPEKMVFTGSNPYSPIMTVKPHTKA